MFVFCSADQQSNRLPETSPTLTFSYFLYPSNVGIEKSEGDKSNNNQQLKRFGKETDSVQSILLNFTFFMLDKVRRYRLSREGKLKADKKRQGVEENFLKLTHSHRQEAAQVLSIQSNK